jgi:diaminohydroxyphosphoribosylaminopyrimidine deaminase / 5-amino-6-(5-phosphoribosylamino)uracil reductase
MGDNRRRMSDHLYMRRAIALSRKGFPAPNPHVGCVLVRDGRIVGEGYHAYAGAPHAESVALDSAGSEAEGSTAYVTLEPCSHHGRTPPCADALIAAGVRRVVCAVKDPNPAAAGGAERLARSGVQVEVGLGSDEAAEANRIFLASFALGRPFVVAKAAMTLDGRIALPSGESRWITGVRARRVAHRLRAQCGAVLVGRSTVQFDDPELTVRLPGVRTQPVRVVLDPNAVLSGNERVFQGPGQVVWAVRTAKDPRQLVVPAGDAGLDLSRLLAHLGQAGTRGVLVEGGAITLQSFLAAGLVDRLELMVAPKIFGAGPAWIEGALAKSLAQVPRCRIDRVRKLGDDLWLTLSPE